MDRFSRLVTGRPIVTLAFVLLATLGLGFGATRLDTRNNQDSELPASDPIVRTNDRLKEVFGDKASVLIGLEADDVFTPGTLRKVAELSERLKQVEGVIEDEIVSLATVNNIEGREWGLEVGRILDEVPGTPEEVERLRATVRANDMLNGQLVSEDGTLTLIQANLEKGYDQEAVHAQVFALAQEFGGPERIHVAGDAVQPQEIDRGIQADLHLLLPLVLLFTLVGLYFSFRTWRGVWIPFAVVVLSVVWTMGLMGHIGLPVTVVSSTLPILMVAISNSYGIHILARYYEQVKDGVAEPARRGLERIGPAVLMTGITSALGSATLLTFRVTSIREFGIIAALGVLATTVVSLTFTPAVLALLKPKGGKAAERHWIDRLTVPLGSFAVRRRNMVFAGAAVVFAVSVVGISRIQIGNDLSEYFPADHRLRTAFDVFNAKLGGVRRMEIMVEGPEADAVKDPEMLRRIQAFQEYAEGFPEVGRTSSFADVVRRIHQEMNGGDPAYHVVPDSRDLVAQYLLLYSMSGNPADFAQIVDYDYQRARIQVMLTTSDQGDQRRLYEQFQKYAAENMGPGVKMEFGGDVMFWLAQIHYVAVGKVYNIIAAVCIVLLFCTLVFRAFSVGLLSIVPLVVSTTLTFGLMGFLGIRLEMGTAIITSIAVGIGVDFALHYLMHLRQEIHEHADAETAVARVQLTTGRAIVFDMLSNVLGFSVLIFSGFMPIRYFGWLVSLTMLTVGIGTLLLMPALVTALRPRFGTGRVTPGSHPVTTHLREVPMPKREIAVPALLFFALLAGAPAAASAQALTGKQIIERNDAMRAVNDEQVDFRMQLINKRGQKRERQVTWMLKEDAQRNQKALIRFLAPADVRGTGLLSVENPDREDDQWLYLPALRKSRRISAANKSDSFVGSDFAFEDVGPEEMDQYEYRLVREAPLQGVPVYVVEAVPNNDKRRRESGYSRREIFVRKDNFAIARVNFYDKQGELLKTLEARDIRQIPSTRTWRAHTMEMKNQKTGHSTVIVYGDFAVNRGLADDAFSMRELERGL
ncbi:MAG TPA: outer membrane lipoprotein-sorting protein [Longimicrobiaceae bacterium]|nr:outer membrane lipoprotein-sorting protein [Longimicrobiaceae bacterium]